MATCGNYRLKTLHFSEMKRNWHLKDVKYDMTSVFRVLGVNMISKLKSILRSVCCMRAKMYLHNSHAARSLNEPGFATANYCMKYHL